MITMTSPIKYRLKDKYLQVRAGENQHWENAKVLLNGASSNSLTPMYNKFANDFTITRDIANNLGLSDNWLGKWFYKDWVGVNGHSGWDWTAPKGTCLYACFDSEVVYVRGDNAGYGELIIYVSDEFRIDGERVRLTSVNGHLEEQYVKVGDRVKQGQLIGLCDNTGPYTTGSHLHLGMRLLFAKKKAGMVEYPYLKGWYYNPKDKNRGYINYFNLFNKKDFDVKRMQFIEDHEGYFLQWTEGVGANGAVYEIVDGELVHWDTAGNPKINKFHIVHRVLKLLRTGIQPNRIIAINTEQYEKYKDLIIKPKSL